MLSLCYCIKYIVLKLKNILYWINIYQFIYLKFYNICLCKCNCMKKRVYYIIYNICLISILKKNLCNKVNKNKIEKKNIEQKIEYYYNFIFY